VRPRHGSGTVFLTQRRDGGWNASWQDSEAITGVEGNWDTVLAWARQQPAAARLVAPWGAEAHTPLPADD
jgi:hypothetical protein